MESVPHAPRPEQAALRSEVAFAVGYFCLYLSYLFLRREGEILHWLSLVAIPFAFLLWRRRAAPRAFSAALASVGLARGRLGAGLLWGVVIGAGLSVLQLVVSRNRGQIVEVFQSGRAAYLLPLTFLLMVMFAGFTEEFFFRGVLQTRLAQRLPSVWAVIVTSLLFGAYHLPYAYLNPQWPSHGDWSASFAAAFGQGVPAGLILGTLYARSHNLLAAVVCHALINTLPGMLQIKFGR